MQEVQQFGHSNEGTASPSFTASMGPLFFLVGLFFINFLSRIVLSPLMPTMEKDLGIGHDQAGFLFFFISFGYFIGMLTSGFVSSRLRHRKTIILSSFAVGGALLWVSFCENFWGIRLGLLAMGLTAGFYLPSGIETLTELVPPWRLGRALAIHEIAPTLAFILAPVLAEFLLQWGSWQRVLTFIGIISLTMGLIFFLWGKGGNVSGEAPNIKILRNILKEPSFWLMVFFFSLGIGSTAGVYMILPLYLVAEKGMDQTLANTLLGFSRIAILAAIFFAGWLTDRLGIKKTMKGVFFTCGLATAMLGIFSGPWLILFIFLQPILVAFFFPVGFVALTKMKSPYLKKVAVSLTAPMGHFIGGAVSAGFGILGEAGFFYLGFILLGGLLLIGAWLTKYLVLSDGAK